jgi:hypothetical protein
VAARAEGVQGPAVPKETRRLAFPVHHLEPELEFPRTTERILFEFL